MDAREAIQLKNDVLAEVRKLINAKFQSNNEVLSPDSKQAIQQLAVSVSAVRDEITKTHSSFRIISATVDNLNQQVSTITTDMKDSKVLKNLDDLKLGLNKVWDHLASVDIVNRFNILEKASADMVNRISALERQAAVPAKRNGTTESVTQPTIDNAAVKDLEIKVADLTIGLQKLTIDIQNQLSTLAASSVTPTQSVEVTIVKDIETKVLQALNQLHAVNLEITNLQNQINDNKNATSVTLGSSTEDVTALKDRIIAVELAIASLTTATIDSETTRNQVQKAEIELLKARLDQSDKKISDLEAKLKSSSVQTAPAVAQAPIPIQEPVKVAVNQPASATSPQSTTPTASSIVQSAFAPFSFGFASPGATK